MTVEACAAPIQARGREEPGSARTEAPEAPGGAAGRADAPTAPGSEEPASAIDRSALDRVIGRRVIAILTSGAAVEGVVRAGDAEALWLEDAGHSAASRAPRSSASAPVPRSR